jgi:hypothetical protein
MQKIEVNVLTGEQKIVDLTADEVAQAQVSHAAWEAEQAQRQSTPTFEQTIQSQADTITALIARISALENR